MHKTAPPSLFVVRAAVSRRDNSDIRPQTCARARVRETRAEVGTCTHAHAINTFRSRGSTTILGRPPAGHFAANDDDQSEAIGGALMKRAAVAHLFA